MNYITKVDRGLLQTQHESTRRTHPVKAKQYGRTQRGPNCPLFQVSLAALVSYLSLPYMARKWTESKAFDTFLGRERKKKKLHLQNVVCQVWEEKSDPEPNTASCKDRRFSPEKDWPGSPEPPAMDSSLKRSLFSKMIYWEFIWLNMNSFLGWNVLFNVRSAWESHYYCSRAANCFKYQITFFKAIRKKMQSWNCQSWLIDTTFFIFSLSEICIHYINLKNAKWHALSVKYVTKML